MRRSRAISRLVGLAVLIWSPEAHAAPIAVQVSAGEDYACAVTDTGGVKCWGDNRFGQLGDGTPTSGVVSISAGSLTTCALTDVGGVKCWGIFSSTPADVEGLTRGILSVTGKGYSRPAPRGSFDSEDRCAVTDTGGVKCWGYSRSCFNPGTGGSCSDYSSSPATVDGLTNAVVSVSVGSLHRCAVTNTGGVKCWGDNDSGQLGDGTREYRSTPADVVGLTSGVISISAGSIHTCAVTDTSGVKCWGDNDSGQLGDGTTDDRPTPVDVLGLTRGVISISAGYYHTCAVTDTGGVKCWGDNNSGQLGDGTTDDRPTPVDVVGLTSGVVSVSAGLRHTCAVTDTGGVKCWGGESSTPRDIIGFGPQPSLLQITPDGSQIMIQKDFSSERWSISYEPASGLFLGNVFKTDGSPPSFIVCNRTAADEETLTFSCQGADACRDASCPGTRADGSPDWESITDGLVVPVSFFEPREVESLSAASPKEVDSRPEAQPTGSSFQSTPDGSQVLIQKDYGSERWSISYEPASGLFLGNVFKTDGSPPSFIVCNRTAADEDNLTFSCQGADACRDASCPGRRADGGLDWVLINENFVVPVSFFQPRPTASPACIYSYAESSDTVPSSCVEFDVDKGDYDLCSQAIGFLSFESSKFVQCYCRTLAMEPCDSAACPSITHQEIEPGNACPGVSPAPGQ